MLFLSKKATLDKSKVASIETLINYYLILAVGDFVLTTLTLAGTNTI